MKVKEEHRKQENTQKSNSACIEKSISECFVHFPIRFKSDPDEQYYFRKIFSLSTTFVF